MIKSKDLRAKRAAIDEQLSKVERNETENADFTTLGKQIKAGDFGEGDEAVAVKVDIHLLNRLRRLEQRVRQLEGD